MANVKINNGAPTFTVNKTGMSLPVYSPVWPNLNRTTKPLLKIAVVGDSIMARPLGGYIPVGLDEGLTNRPLRLTYNNVSRRLYDLLCWNKPIWKRLDNVAWTKSGTWTTNTSMFDPVYTEPGFTEFYYQTSTSSDWAEIVIPDGMENFAFICQRDTSFSSLSITLNGGSITSYGPSSVTCARTRLSGEEDGNPYHVVEYNNLPAGANTIRITKAANSNTARIWGGFYWTGNTVIVHNLGHSGHTMGELMTEHITPELVENNYDAVLFEVTEINELSTTGDLPTTLADLQDMIDLFTMDRCIMSCNPLGTDPTDGTPNYYVDFPGQETMDNSCKAVVEANHIAWIDIFAYIKSLVIADGGTLEDGDAGIYTIDGNHPNPTGVDKQWIKIYEKLHKELQS